MLKIDPDDGVSPVVAVVAAQPGISRAAAARALHCRRAAALALVDQALARDLVHVDASAVPIRAGATRTVDGLYPGPAAFVLFAQPSLSGERMRAARIGTGVPAGGLATQLGVSTAQLRRWESGQQPVPARFTRQFTDALEAAQTAHLVSEAAPAVVGRTRHPRNTQRRLRELLAQVREHPGRTRNALVRTRTVDARLLEHALATRQAHEAPSWTERTRQPVLGIYPGPAPVHAPTPVLVADLARARRRAGWSQDRLADRLGVARATWARWERELREVPGWVTPAATVLREVESAPAAGHPRDRLLAVVQAAPGSTWSQVYAAAGYSANPTARRYRRELLESGQVHERWRGERGQRHGWVYPGPAPAETLTPAQLVAARKGAGLTQRQLAELAGVDLASVRVWEESRRRIPEHEQDRLVVLLADQPDAVELEHQALLAALLGALAAQPRTRRQLDLLELGSRAQLDAALAELEAARQLHRGRIGAGVVGSAGRMTRGRVGYLLGPAPEIV